MIPLNWMRSTRAHDRPRSEEQAIMKQNKEKNCDNCKKEYCDDVYYGFNEHCGYESQSHTTPRFEYR